MELDLFAVNYSVFLEADDADLLFVHVVDELVNPQLSFAVLMLYVEIFIVFLGLTKTVGTDSVSGDALPCGFNVPPSW